MRPDSTGFLYAEADAARCIGCGLCERVCPVLAPFEGRKPLKAYAAKHCDAAIVEVSSSGGAFSAIAEVVLNQGGVVFGAATDEAFAVVHRCVTSVDDLGLLRGSKYVQSRIGDCFVMVRKLLEKGIRVLFCGTPCQIAGLNHFLRKDYGSLLLTTELICHGVPGPKTWQTYLTRLQKTEGLRISGVYFREKRSNDYGLSVNFDGETQFYQSFRKNLYYRGFLRNFFLRPSCFECPAKGGRSAADFTIGDAWGVEKEYAELSGKNMASLLLVNSEKAMELLESLSLIKQEISAAKALEHNKSFYSSTKLPEFYSLFRQMWSESPDRALDMVANLKTGFALKRLVFKLIYRLKQ